MDRPFTPFRPDVLLTHREWGERTARALVHGEAEAEDVVQQAWLEILQRPPATEPRRPQGWLRSVLRFTALDRMRSERRRRHHEEGAARPERLDVAPPDIVARAETIDRVVHAVLNLEEPYRTTVLLRYFEDLAPQAIAARQGIPVETVRTRLKRAVARLRGRLDAESGGDRRRWCLALLPLLRRSTSGTAATGGAPAIAAAGVLLMGAKTKAAVAGAALLLGAAGILLWRPWTDTVATSPTPPNRTAVDAHQGSPRGSSSEAPRPNALPSPDSVSPPALRRTASGRVVDRDGHPVRGARVVSVPDDLDRPLDVASIQGESGPGRVAHSRKDGTFSVALSGEAPLHLLHAEADGYGSVVTTGVRHADEITVVLEKPGVLTGRVSDSSGDSVPGAAVRVSALIGPTRSILATTTAADGTYRLAGMPTAKGLLTLEVSAEGLATAVQILEETARPGQELRHDITLARGGVLRGRVLDGRTREGVPGARVVLCATPVTAGRGWAVSYESGGRRSENPDAWKALDETTTGSDGGFRIERLPPGGVNPGIGVYAGALKDGWTPRLERVTLANPGEEVELDFLLWPSAELRGRVLEGRGPAQGVTVIASVAGIESGAWFPSIYGDIPVCQVVTDGEGRYRVRGLPVPGPGPARVEVRAYSRSLMFQMGGEAKPGAQVEVDAPAGETTLAPDLVLPEFRAAGVDLLVVDREGRPIGGAEFSATGSSMNPRTDVRGRARLLWAPGASPQPSQSVIVRAQGFGPVATKVVPDEDDPPMVRVVLGVGHTVRGKVLGLSSELRERTVVMIANGNLAPEEAFRRAIEMRGEETSATFPPLRIYAVARPDDDGRFLFEDLPDGPYFLKAVLYLPEDPSRQLPARSRESPVLAVGSGPGEVTLELPPESTPR